jgi:hypothetical protein
MQQHCAVHKFEVGKAQASTSDIFVVSRIVDRLSRSQPLGDIFGEGYYSFYTDSEDSPDAKVQKVVA